METGSYKQYYINDSFTVTKPVKFLNTADCREKCIYLLRNLIQGNIFCNETKSLKTKITELAVWSIKSQHWPNVVGSGSLIGGLPGP